MALPASSSGLFRFVSPRSRPQSTDIVAAASWGVFAGTAALYLVQPDQPDFSSNEQAEYSSHPIGLRHVLRPETYEPFEPFDWIKKTFFEKPEPEA